MNNHTFLNALHRQGEGLSLLLPGLHFFDFGEFRMLEGLSKMSDWRKIAETAY